MDVLLCRSSNTNQQCGSVCVCAQILLEGARCYPPTGSDCLSAGFVWRQLVPDFAALVRSLCVAVDAWPPEVAKPKIFADVVKSGWQMPLGLQYNVRPSLATCSTPCSRAAHGRLAAVERSLRKEAPAAWTTPSMFRLMTQRVRIPTMPGMLAPQHMHICALLYKRIVQPTRGPVAGDADRRAYIEAVCEQATADLLCWSMENGLGTGDAQSANRQCLRKVQRHGCLQTVIIDRVALP